jgi:putative transposase
MAIPESLTTGHFYHIYNRGNNRETIFREPENYRFFLQQYIKYIQPVAATHAYCLLPNHFHLLVYIRTKDEQQQWHQSCQLLESWQLLEPRLAFKNLFISYSMSYNRRYDRTGSLFQKPFKRKRIDSDRYLVTLLIYIHQNPQLHGLVDDFRVWPWSSYSAHLSDRPTKIQREEVLDWFGNRADFAKAHSDAAEETLISSLIDNNK